MKKVIFVFVVLFTLTACDVPNFYYPSAEGERITETSYMVRDGDRYCLR